MKIVFMGTPQFGKIVLEKLHEKHPVSLVVTQPDKRLGRKQRLVYGAVKEYAIANSLKLFQPINLRKNYQEIINLKPDLIVTAAYGQMIPSAVIDNFCCLNIHGSLLPKYRGGAPIQRALMKGEKSVGVTLMYMANKMDSGDIIAQKEIVVEKDDTTTILMEKLADLGSDLLLKYLKSIVKKTAPRMPQDETLVTFAPNLGKTDEKLDFNLPTFLLLRQLSALLDEPGAFFTNKAKQVKVYKMEKSDIISSARAGTVLAVKNDLIIKTKDAAVKLLIVQEQGKRKMAIKDYLNGQKIINKGDVVNE